MYQYIYIQVSIDFDDDAYLTQALDHGTNISEEEVEIEGEREGNDEVSPQAENVSHFKKYILHNYS